MKTVFLIVTMALSGLCGAQVKSSTMSGFVTDKESRPLEGARVTVIGNKAKSDTTTDSDGAFVVSLAEGVEEGTTVRIQIEKAGYKPYEKLLAASSAIPLRVSLESVGSKPLAHAPRSPIEKTDSFSTLVPFHGEWKNSPIPTNENLGDSHQEYYDSLFDLASRPDKQPEGWPVYKDRKFESPGEQFAFVTRLVQFDTFRSIYFLQRGVVSGLKWTAGVGVTPINKQPIKPPDATDYPNQELLDALSGNEFLNPRDELLWKGRPFSVPRGTRVSFLERSNPEKGQVLTCTVRLERPGYFKLDFEIQPGPGMNNQLPAGFSTQAVQGTTTFVINVAMKYAIQRKQERDFQPEWYAAWAESLFDGLKRSMAFVPAPVSSGAIDSTQQRRVFKVTAKSGESITVRDGFMLYWPSNPEYEGIRVRQAGGHTVAAWNRIERIDVTNAADPQAIQAEITGPDGTKVAVTLEPASLNGKTALGDYTASVGDLLTIIPAPRSEK